MRSPQDLTRFPAVQDREAASAVRLASKWEVRRSKEACSVRAIGPGPASRRKPAQRLLWRWRCEASGPYIEGRNHSQTHLVLNLARCLVTSRQLPVASENPKNHIAASRLNCSVVTKHLSNSQVAFGVPSHSQKSGVLPGRACGTGGSRTVPGWVSKPSVRLYPLPLPSCIFR